MPTPGFLSPSVAEKIYKLTSPFLRLPVGFIYKLDSITYQISGFDRSDTFEAIQCYRYLKVEKLKPEVSAGVQFCAI
jgi:hypothetical protein